ncbi:MAG TPA: hypothetical protein VGP99_04925, partial [Tepidisphaeraceae bacterium]|nr:hypothetical protein [Tepidisphaeraceae bacterium]
SLTLLGPVVLFSAAIPFQGGVNHVNEQWPSHWTKLFLGRGYAMIDCIRRRIWENEQVADYYAQNMLLFCRHDFLEGHPALRAEQDQGLDGLSIVHPRKFVEQAKAMQRLYAAAGDLRSVIIPKGTRFILVDEEEIRGVIAVGYDVLPFLERDGQYWGKPVDAQSAIRELERMRDEGSRFIAFAWPAFWWLEYYLEFHQHLSEQYPCVLRNERFIIFDLG